MIAPEELDRYTLAVENDVLAAVNVKVSTIMSGPHTLEDKIELATCVLAGAMGAVARLLYTSRPAPSAAEDLAEELRAAALPFFAALIAAERRADA